MSVIETVQSLIAALQANDLELAASKLADNFTLSGLAPQKLDKGALLATQSELHAAMSDFSYNLDEAREESGSVHALIAITGTQTNDLALPILGLQNIPATGLSIVLPQVPVEFEVEGEQVTRMSIKEVAGGGLTGLLQQVGAELPVAPVEGELSE